MRRPRKLSEIERLAIFLDELTCGEDVAREVRLSMIRDPRTAELFKSNRTPRTSETKPMLRLVGTESAQRPG